MVTVNIHEAKTHLSKLVDRAAKGESFVIAKAGKPLVKVVALDYGSARTGVAVSDPTGTLATPRRTLRRSVDARAIGEDLARRAGLHPRPLATPHPAAGGGPAALLTARALAFARFVRHLSPSGRRRRAGRFAP